ncbi:hypothetical protein F5Y17DRAFT_435145 [Xylariaceae sp. FL0594]|nr:hypothetical protein F5Y17DRAFT_435145 [Xylariaceae sp. FL0594]
MQTFHLHLYLWSTEEADHEDIDIYVRSFDAFFRIRYNRALLGNSSLYSSFLNSLRILRGDNEKERAEEVERLKKDFEPLMSELTARPPVASSTNYLYNFLYPPWFVLNATVAPDNMTMQPQCEKKIWRHDIDFPGGYIVPRRRECLLEPLASVDLYSSRQVRLLPSSSQGKLDPYLGGPGKVSVGDITCYFKAWEPGRGKHGATYHELQAYRKIANAIAEGKLPHDIRISRLYGAVVDHDNDLPQHFPPAEHGPTSGKRLVGILLTYVENKGTLYLTAPWSDVTEDRRLRWADELEILIRTLHGAGLVWGDAKPHNVLVDTMDNLWLIDFGGSFTQGWVDEEKRDTAEGDLQGLERIKNWLSKWSKKPVQRFPV